MSHDSTTLPLPVPLLLQPWIALNLEFGVLLCIRSGCNYAATPGYISRHLHEKHQANIQVRKQVDQYIQQFLLQQQDYSPQTVPLPPDRSRPQPILPVLDGFQCQDCEYKTRNRKAVREHANKQHNKKRAQDEHVFRVVRLQSWFGEKRERYWVVDESQGTGQGTSTAVSVSRERSARVSGSGSGSGGEGESEGGDRDAAIKARVAEWSEEVKERRLLLSQQPPAIELDPWLRYTGWNAVLLQSKHNLVKTAEFTRMPDAEEVQLVQVLQAWSRILERCLDTLTAVDHKDVLKWWQSPKNEVASQHPFELPQNASTLDKYSRRWQSFLCYVMRTVPKESWEDESETGVKYTERQWNRVQELRTLLDQRPGAVAVAVAEDDHKLDTAVMGLIQSIVTQDTSRVPLYESPLMHFLAVCGIDPVTRSFRTSFVYTPILAQVLWILRLVLLEIALPLQAWPELELYDLPQARSVARRVHTIREKHLCEGSFSPASSILTQLALGKALNKLHRSPSNIYWSDDRKIVYYDGKGVTMAKIRVMWQELWRQLKEILDELLFHQGVPDVPLAEVVDHMGSAQNFRRDNFSFLDHVENHGTCKKDWQFLYQRMLHDEPKWQLVKIGSGSADREWIDVRKSAYLNREGQFLSKLMVAMHVMGGQPARGPELGSIKVVNSVYSARNIYVINGRVVFLTVYDKARKRRGNTEYVLRCLPDQLSQILAKYLIYVRPFSQVVGQREWDYLFADEGGPWAGAQLTQALAAVTNKHLGVRLTVLSWRQVAIAIANQHLAQASKTWDQEGGEEEGDEEFAEGEDEAEVELNVFQHILVRQSAHGQRVARRHYAIDGAFLNFLGPELVNAYTQASRAWHIFFKIDPAGEGAAVAVAVAGESVKHGRRASWQLQPTVAKREKRITGEEAGIIAQRQAKEGLCRIYGPDAKPQSEGQAAALELVHRPGKKTAPLIIILPTGSGKTVLFFSVAAMAVNQSVIVVVPFAALVDDLITRARTGGSGSGSGGRLTCQEWLGQGSITVLPQLIVVSADRAVQGEFLHFAKGLELHGQLAHVFFDECHVAFTDTSYRKRLRELWQLRYLDCPFTCLTATLLVSLEHVLKERLLIQQATLFRRSTMRRTIRYTVRDVGKRFPSEVAEELIPSLPLPPGQRGVIYVRSYATGTALQETLGFPFYKAQCDEKGEVLRQWVSGSGGWILATGALGTGVNIAGIVYVVHVDRPYGLTSFMQQSGRGGRSGEVSDSIVLVRVGGSGSGGVRGSYASAYSVEHQDERALEGFLSSPRCRREVLAREFDGDMEGTSCVATDSILCDRCQESLEEERRAQVRERILAQESESEEGSGSGSGRGSPSRTDNVPGSVAIAQALQLAVQQDEQLFQVMDRLQRHCIYCELVHADQGEMPTQMAHIYRTCDTARQAGCSAESFDEWRHEIRLARSGQCYWCGLGEEACSAVEEGRECKYPHIMLSGIFILHAMGTLETICESVGFLGEYQRSGGSGGSSDTRGEQWQWLNETEEESHGQRRELRWMRVWRNICRQYWDMVSECGSLS